MAPLVLPKADPIAQVRGIPTLLAIQAQGQGLKALAEAPELVILLDLYLPLLRARDQEPQPEGPLVIKAKVNTSCPPQTRSSQ